MKGRSLSALIVAVLSASACAGVLGIRPPGRRPFEHRTHSLEGIHCLKCHGSVGLAGDEGSLHMPSTSDCVSCHEEPHDTRDCGGCHGLRETRAAAAAAREALFFEHKTHMPRVKGDCVRCHIDVQHGAEKLRPSMGTCLGCHEHSGEMVAQKCDRCHVDLEREGIRPEEAWAHGPNFMREHGVRAATAGEVCSSCHADRFCSTCHSAGVAPATPAKMAPHDPFNSSVHRAGFMARHANEARSSPGLCSTCHSPSTCATCHAERSVSAGAAGARSPHPRGWLGPPGSPNEHGRATFRDPALCASCHGGAGEQLCVGCHRVGGIGGNPHPPGFVARGDARTEGACRLCHRGAL